MFRQQGDEMPNRSKKDVANAEFKKIQRAEDGKKAMTEYESEGAAIRAKTERLRALRLARDAAEQNAPPKPAAAVKKAPAKKGKGKSAPLSKWLDDQKSGGHKR
jgi:hypothetical protein